LQILTRCGIVAKQEPPVALVSAEKTALAAYIAQVQFSGKQITIVSLNADSLVVVGTIYYNGQYSSVIQANVISALNAYCSNLSSPANFGSAVYLKDVEEAILSVQGVTDIKLYEVSVRADSVAIESRYKIYDLLDSVNQRLFTPISGYVIEETSTDWTFKKTLSFIANQ
jgi:hypothetical protein